MRATPPPNTSPRRFWTCPGTKLPAAQVPAPRRCQPLRLRHSSRRAWTTRRCHRGITRPTFITFSMTTIRPGITPISGARYSPVIPAPGCTRTADSRARTASICVRRCSHEAGPPSRCSCSATYMDGDRRSGRCWNTGGSPAAEPPRARIGCSLQSEIGGEVNGENETSAARQSVCQKDHPQARQCAQPRVSAREASGPAIPKLKRLPSGVLATAGRAAKALAAAVRARRPRRTHRRCAWCPLCGKGVKQVAQEAGRVTASALESIADRVEPEGS